MAARTTATGEYPALPLGADDQFPVIPALSAARFGLFGNFAMRLIVVFALVFLGGLTVVMAQARVNADDPVASLSELLTPPDGCSMPCWHGIQPGSTTVAEAVAALEQLPFVAEVRIVPGMISWWWNDFRPTVYEQTGRAFDGRIETAVLNGEERVISVVLQTTLTLGQMELALGDPDSRTLHTVHPDNDRQADGVVHIAHYGSVNVFNILTCPMDVVDFWNSPVYVAFGTPNLAFEGDVFQSELLPGWFFRDTAPGCTSN
ncbi:MAG: hypothetical protein UZ15_CFX003001242 [Chloroflexi bacterium OLB15]|nr:MAG: hypothetical protein UZ15_CFX003001242 [Chloroflexi bacterium OLB15]